MVQWTKNVNVLSRTKLTAFLFSNTVSTLHCRYCDTTDTVEKKPLFYILIFVLQTHAKRDKTTK